MELKKVFYLTNLTNAVNFSLSQAFASEAVFMHQFIYLSKALDSTDLSLHPRKWRTRAPVLTGGPGTAPGGMASKNGWVYMRVQRGVISYSLESLSVCYLLSLNDSWSVENWVARKVARLPRRVEESTPRP